MDNKQQFNLFIDFLTLGRINPGDNLDAILKHIKHLYGIALEPTACALWLYNAWKRGLIEPVTMPDDDIPIYNVDKLFSIYWMTTERRG